MNKQELVEAIAKRSGHSNAESSRYLETMIEVVEENLRRGEEIRVTGFGKFSVRERAAREGRNPQTGESMTIPAEGHVFVRCENGHEDQFTLSYEQAPEPGLHRTGDLPETRRLALPLQLSERTPGREHWNHRSDGTQRLSVASSSSRASLCGLRIA